VLALIGKQKTTVMGKIPITRQKLSAKVLAAIREHPQCRSVKEIALTPVETFPAATCCPSLKRTVWPRADFAEAGRPDDHYPDPAAEPSVRLLN
jgi:hypothetical protein